MLLDPSPSCPYTGGSPDRPCCDWLDSDRHSWTVRSLTIDIR